MDPDTAVESTAYGSDELHVRTMDLSIIQRADLRKALKMGLNHIPLKPTNISVCLVVAFDAFAQFVAILSLRQVGFPIDDVESWFREKCLSLLKSVSKQNKSGFRFSGQDLLEMDAVRNEINFLLNHLYYAGLDKMSNNACFICIKHIRHLALLRLNSHDFSPCK